MYNKGSIENVLLSKEKKEKIILRVICFYVYPTFILMIENI